MALAQWVGAEDVEHRRQAKGRVERVRCLDRRAVQDAQPDLACRLVSLWGSAVGDGEVIDEDAVPLLVLVHRRVRARLLFVLTLGRPTALLVSS